MRLSTERDRDEASAIAVVHAALDTGVTLLDTADAYCLDHTDIGHNERLVAHALSTWDGDRSRIRVATKGGLTRPDGNWIADGRARHLMAACEASRRALGVERIDLYQLHAPDPRTPFATSIRALASFQRDGLVERIGLCNVTVGQIEEARAIAEIESVQVELTVWNDDNVLGGVVGYCLANGIQLLAHRPLGGTQRIRRTFSDRTLVDLARRHGVTPADIALSWLMDLSDLIVPLPGPTRVETASSLGRARDVRFTSDDRALLDERFPAGRTVRRSRADPGKPFDSAQAKPLRTDGEIVLVMGLPAAGKSTVARALVDEGYARVNRDEGGGSLRGLLAEVERQIRSGHARIVLDNTYVSRKSRGAVLRAAALERLPVRCVWLTTSLEDAQVNAASRMIGRFGRLLEPQEIRQASKHDPSVFGPGVQFRYQRELEPPHSSEGFSRIDPVPFERARDASFTNRALLVWCDGVVAHIDAVADTVEVFEGRGDLLRRYQGAGWRLLGLGWQPGIAEEIVTREQVDAVYARMRSQLGVEMEILYCSHAAGPPVCWCRKPLPGLGVMFIDRYRLDPSQCLYVGAGPQDPGFARRLGFQYRDADAFFRDETTVLS